MLTGKSPRGQARTGSRREGEAAVIHDDPAPEVVALVGALGHRMLARTESITEGMGALLAVGVAGIDNDPDLTELMVASVRANVTTIFHVLANNIPIDNLQPTTAAVEYALRSAQRGVPGNALRRAYHVGQDDLQNEIFNEIRGLECSDELKLKVMHRTTQVINGYIDWITQYVLDAYDEERQRWVSATGNMRTVLINRLLNRQNVDPDAFCNQTGYALDQYHLGLVVWAEDGQPDQEALMQIQHFVLDLAHTADLLREPITTAIDRSTIWAWLPLRSGPDRFDLDDARRVAAKNAKFSVSFGLPSPGPSGFRRTHQQAQATRSLAGVSDHFATGVSYGDQGVAICSVLAQDLDTTRLWVHEVLGALATNSESHERLRETLRVFLAADGSYTESAETLNLHRNSVKYRVLKAGEERGRPIATDRLDVELALQVCSFLGESVLSPG